MRRFQLLFCAARLGMIFLLLAVVSSSCNVQKRHDRPGFNVARKTNHEAAIVRTKLERAIPHSNEALVLSAGRGSVIGSRVASDSFIALPKQKPLASRAQKLLSPGLMALTTMSLSTKSDREEVALDPDKEDRRTLIIAVVTLFCLIVVLYANMLHRLFSGF